MHTYDIIGASSEEIDQIDSQLAEFNGRQVPFTQEQNLILKNYVIKDSGKNIAAIKAEIYHWGILYIYVLFVDEQFRGQGFLLC